MRQATVMLAAVSKSHTNLLMPYAGLLCPAGKPGSQLRSINTYRLRPACTPVDTQLKAYQSLERSKRLPNSTAPQGIRITDIVYKVCTAVRSP
jgi:hypothetical protein